MNIINEGHSRRFSYPSDIVSDHHKRQLTIFEELALQEIEEHSKKNRLRFMVSGKLTLTKEQIEIIKQTKENIEIPENWKDEYKQNRLKGEEKSKQIRGDFKVNSEILKRIKP